MNLNYFIRKLCFNKSPSVVVVGISTNDNESFSDSYSDSNQSSIILIEEIMEGDATVQKSNLGDNEPCAGFSGGGLLRAIEITTPDIDANLADDDSIIEAELNVSFVQNYYKVFFTNGKSVQ